jgi:hypothetical protein
MCRFGAASVCDGGPVDVCCCYRACYVGDQLFVSLAVLKAGFYWTHRLFHSKYFYAKYHKQHHEYAGTIGFAAEYAHPLEQIIRCAPLCPASVLQAVMVKLWLRGLQQPAAYGCRHADHARSCHVMVDVVSLAPVADVRIPFWVSWIDPSLDVGNLILHCNYAGSRSLFPFMVNKLVTTTTTTLTIWRRMPVTQ